MNLPRQQKILAFSRFTFSHIVRISVPFAASALLLVAPASAQPPTCPEYTTTRQIPADEGAPPEELMPHSGRMYAFVMAPCETVLIQFDGLPGVNSSANMSLTIRNAAHEDLATTYIFCESSSCSATVPSLNSPVGYPEPGTRGTQGLPAEVYVYVDVGSTVMFTLTITTVPRPGYNTGGTSLSNASLISTESVQYGSVHPWEPGQFYKVHLNTGQFIYVSGQATGAGALFGIQLYDASQQPQDNLIVSTAVPETTQFPGPGYLPTYTNSGAAADFYLKVWAQYGILQDIQFAVQTAVLTSFTLSGTNTALAITSSTTLYDSTGDTTNYITSTPTPMSAFINPRFTPSTPTSNPNSSCATTLSYGNSTANGPVNNTVRASATGGGSCINASGIFSVSATAMGVSSSNSLTLVVPPQVMIQTLVAEMGGQTAAGDDSMPAALLVGKNRFGDSGFPGGTTGTWQSVLVPSEFQGLPNGTANGLSPEIKHASEVFAGTTQVSIPAGCKSYWSPTNARYSTLSGWTSTQANALTNTDWTGVGASGTTWSNQPRQAVVKRSIANSHVVGNESAPALVLFRLAPLPTDPAVIYID